MSNRKISLNRRRIITLLVLSIGFSVGLNHLFGGMAIAQNTSQTSTQSETYVANVNEVKTFIYSWFALLDRQVSKISLLKFLDLDNLTMQFPEMTVNNSDDFSKWYLGVQEAIKSNTHDVKLLEVTPKKNGEFDVKLVLDWQAKTRQGETVTQAYRQRWKIVTNENRRLLIQEYLVEEVE